MLAAVGHPFAVNPDKALRREALERGWPVLVFRRPVHAPQRRPLPTPPGPPAAYLAAVAVGTAGLAWWATRRRTGT